MEKETNQTKRLGALLLLAGLGLAGTAGGCLHLNQQLHAGLLREEALTAQIHQLEEQLTQQQTALEQAQEETAFLREYSFVTPEGEAPSYTQLYPDFYAQPWTGEEITGGRVVCLTFDDGPSANTDRVLKVLEEQGIQATFFVVGKTGPEAQERMRAILAGGHTLAMHSWSHDYKKLYTSVEAFLEDFYQLYQWIYEVTGQYPLVFRFPGGSINAHSRGIYQELVAEMTRRGFVYFDWNASAQDATPKPLSPAVITENCLKGIGRDLVVILSHDSAARSTTVEALPSIIQGYREAGYTFAPLTPGVKPVILDYKRES
ncbi:MAG: polysaccharide deacetylase [Lawsonibacter sp.]|nr:polysaccharide deacetylase [Lawsonibacter sp.]